MNANLLARKTALATANERIGPNRDGLRARLADARIDGEQAMGPIRPGTPAS